MNEFGAWLRELLTTGIGAILAILVYPAYVLVRIWPPRGKLSGWWEDRIFDSEGGIDPVKADYLHISHRGASVSGECARYKSVEDADLGRNWRFEELADDLCLVFWEIHGASRNVAGFLMKERGEEYKGPLLFKGRYLARRKHEKTKKVQIVTTRIELRKLEKKPSDWRQYWKPRKHRGWSWRWPFLTRSPAS